MTADEAMPAYTPVVRPLGNGVVPVGVIGTGKISEEHLRYLASDKHVKVVGVCDLSPSLAQYAATRFKAGQPYEDYRTMLEEARPAVVHVLTPAQTHAKIVTDCLESGCHVIVEKPVALSHAAFIDLYNAAKGRGLRLIEDHNYRFNEPIQTLSKLVDEGKLGDIREIDVRMALNVRSESSRYMDKSLPHPSHQMPAGVIHEFISHLCYLALRFLPDDAEFSTVRAAWSKHGDDTIFKFDDLDSLLISGPTHVRIRFTSHSAPDAFEVRLRGTRGWAETDLFQPHVRLVVPRTGGKQLSPLVNQFMNGLTLLTAAPIGLKNKIFQKTPYEGLQKFLRETYSGLRRGNPLPVSFADMDRTSALIDALLDEKNRA